MGLKKRDRSDGLASRITVCPFCGTDLENRRVPVHLEKCDEIQRPDTDKEFTYPTRPSDQ